MPQFNYFWYCIKNAFCSLFENHTVKVGELDLLCGEYEIVLPIIRGCHCEHIKDFWTSVTDCGHPVCHGDEGFNWVSYQVFNKEVLLKVKVKTQKAKVKWLAIY